VVSLQKQVELDDSDESEAAPEKADAPEFDKLTEEEYLKAIQAAGMTTPQTLPKG
jgi:DNA-directed RNA polymerase subunit omega